MYIDVLIIIYFQVCMCKLRVFYFEQHTKRLCVHLTRLNYISTRTPTYTHETGKSRGSVMDVALANGPVVRRATWELITIYTHSEKQASNRFIRGFHGPHGNSVLLTRNFSSAC